MKQYNIYKTTNLINGKFYWGVHDSIDENDGYLGSGTVLRKAIKKYGKENFRRVTKLLYDTAEEAYEDEGFIVNKAMVDNLMSYNTRLGGKGGWEHVDNNGKNHPQFGLHIPAERKEKIRKTMIERGSTKGKNNGMFGVHRFGAEHPMYGTHLSKETKKKIAQKARIRNSGQNNPMSRTNRELRRQGAVR